MNEAYQNSAYGSSSLASYLDEKTRSASPLELVAMVYSKAISEIREARVQLAARNIALRSKAISKACDAIGELDSSLDMEAGGELSLRLRGLYRYCLVRLLDANRHQSDEPLAEVLGLLATLSEAWQTLAQTSAQTSANAEPAAGNNPVGHWEVEKEVSDQAHSWTL
jgi:flagellar secretion chaperone FliS